MKSIVAISFMLSALCLTSCRQVEEVTRVSRSEACGYEAARVEASSVSELVAIGECRQVLVVSVMERDTSTGGLVEVRRETTVGYKGGVMSEKIENSARNEAEAGFSQESDNIERVETKKPSAGLKLSLLLMLPFLAMFAAAAGFVFVYLQKKST